MGARVIVGEPSPSISRLAWTFLRIRAIAFGGLGPALALIERDLVSRRGVLARDALTESLTYTKLLPGSTVVQVVSYRTCPRLRLPLLAEHAR